MNNQKTEKHKIMEDMEKQEPTQWFIFFKDQLLLKKEKTKKGEIKYSVP